MLLLLLVLIFIVLIAIAGYFVARGPAFLSGVPRYPITHSFQEIISPIGAEIRYTKHPELWAEPLYAVFRGSWMVVINDPDLAKQFYTDQETFVKFEGFRERPEHPASRFFGTNVLNANGPAWRKHRKILNPSFHKKNLSKIADTFFVQSINLLLNQIQKIDDHAVPIHTWMQRMTLDVLGRAGFNVDLGSLKDPNAPTVALYNRILKQMFNPLLLFLPHPISTYAANSLPQLNKDINEFDDMLYKVIDERRHAKQKVEDENHSAAAVDLLDLMLTSVDDESGQGLNNNELRSNMVIFFLAGHDTTAHSLSATLYLLAANPEKQEIARNEVRTVCGANNDLHNIERWVGDDGKINDFYVPNYEQQKQLEYITAVVKETLRMYPAVPNIPPRKTSCDVTLSSITIPKNTFCSVAIYSLHHHPNLWHDPFAFIPERFLKNHQSDEALKYPYAWNPFGGSVRSCIGQDFSMIEQKMALAAILLRYRVKIVPTSEKLALKAGFVLTGPKDLLIHFERL